MESLTKAAVVDGPKIEFEWLALLLFIQDAGLNLGLETGYLD
jgi:hypothetical protein